MNNTQIETKENYINNEFKEFTNIIIEIKNKIDLEIKNIEKNESKNIGKNEIESLKNLLNAILNQINSSHNFRYFQSINKQLFEILDSSIKKFENYKINEILILRLKNLLIILEKDNINDINKINNEFKKEIINKSLINNDSSILEINNFIETLKINVKEILNDLNNSDNNNSELKQIFLNLINEGTINIFKKYTDLNLLKENFKRAYIPRLYGLLSTKSSELSKEEQKIISNFINIYNK